MRARKACWQAVAAATSVGLGLLALAAPASAVQRAIELVSPPESAGDIRFGGGVAAPSGDIVCFNAERAMAGAPANGNNTEDDGFCAWRTGSGWETKWVTGPPVAEPRGAQGAQVYYLSDDGARIAFASDTGIAPDYPGSSTGENGLGTLSAFMWENGQTRWLAPSPQPLVDSRDFGPAVGTAREPLAVSHDLRYGLFVSRLRLLPSDTNDLLDLYKWTPDGTRLVSGDENGDAVGGWPGIGSDPNQLTAVPGSISADGSRVFFEHDGALAGSPADVRSVFMREGDQLTLVSPRRGPGPAANVSFEGATPDGSVVYLTSEEQLTGDAKRLGPALYAYDVADDELTLLATAADDTGIAFLGASVDGSTLFYRTTAFTPQFFVRRNGVERLVGDLAFQDTNSLFDSIGNRTDKRAMRISADGSSAVFASYAAFDGSPGGVRQVYRWTPDGGVRWLSRDAAGSAPRGAAAVGNYSTAVPFPGEARFSVTNIIRGRPNLGRVTSDDGSRVFFETADRLVDADVNGFIDVYEWHDGAVSLVSPGTQPADALYHDSSADGRTVFFTTEARLIPELDTNSGPDIYAAREGGGFALPEPAVSCNGDICQGEVQPSRPVDRPASSSFEGPDDSVEPAPIVPRFSLARLTATQRRAFARRGRVVLRLRANVKGIVTATARARIGRRNVVIGRSIGIARRGVTTSLPLSLTRAAKTALRTRRRLRVSITVSYSESRTTLRQAVVLRG